ncbi:hypothetical protein DR950_33535 [Kitasatospora xanthocidica]|uniref:Ricin B lectin domain-containing protein n=1 Tax=Kitasatospora xanthocidica TaxID=83382 RepID=A0A373A1R1_9ACTN|nr:RICIN domain-containing protein [Kitasatospora xanthocidica]RGD62009.1 hypothetical protein DR950_33535 [Kitasatospora xanthocidica]
MKKLLALLGTAALVALPMAGAGSAQAATAANVLWSSAHMANDHSGKCLVARGSGESSAQQYGCDYDLGAFWRDQHWDFTGSSWANVQVRNVNSGLCLTVRGGSDNAVAVQTACDDTQGAYWKDQHWEVRFDPIKNNGHYMLANLNSGKCLAVQGFANDTVAIQFQCNNGYQDQWWNVGN